VPLPYPLCKRIFQIPVQGQKPNTFISMYAALTAAWANIGKFSGQYKTASPHLPVSQKFQIPVREKWQMPNTAGQVTAFIA